MISVIILSWNRKEEMIKTLDLLQKQTYKDYEIIVIDQNSTDGVPDLICDNFPQVKLFEVHKNLGVPEGRNLGAKNAKGNILFFLDNDAHLENNALELCIKKFEENEKLGALGFKILNATTFDIDYTSWVYQKSYLEKADEEFETYTFCGAGHAIRREIFWLAGGYRDEIFFCWEEMDLSIRIMNKGWNIYYYPLIKVYHRITEEKKTPHPVHECQRLKNSLIFYWRYFPCLKK